MQNIADILIDPEGAREIRDHWQKTAYAAAGRRHPACALRREGRRRSPASRALLSDPSHSIDRHVVGDDDDQPPRHR